MKRGRMSNEIRDETREEARTTVMNAVREAGFEDYDEEVWINEAE